MCTLRCSHRVLKSTVHYVQRQASLLGKRPETPREGGQVAAKMGQPWKATERHQCRSRESRPRASPGAHAVIPASRGANNKCLCFMPKSQGSVSVAPETNTIAYVLKRLSVYPGVGSLTRSVGYGRPGGLSRPRPRSLRSCLLGPASSQQLCWLPALQVSSQHFSGTPESVSTLKPPTFHTRDLSC